MIADAISERLRVPAIAAPMFLVSGPELVIAACRNGVIGSFPTANCRSTDELDQWLERIAGAIGPAHAPLAPNLIVHHSNPRVEADLAVLVTYRPEIVITSVGSPAAVIEPIHDYGGLVFADVASMRHVEKAAAAGADGLILLTAGAGGQTGWANPLAFARAARREFDGTLVLAGGVGDGQALHAACVLGCDLAYLGTRFIATEESLADARYKRMLVETGMDGVRLTDAITGLETSILEPSLLAAGLDPNNLPPREAIEISKDINPNAPRRWRDIWSAGHVVDLVEDIPPVAELVERLATEYCLSRAG